MERNEVVHAMDLMPGDIFYRAKDKDKNKLQVHVHQDGPLSRDKWVVCVEPSLPQSLRNKPHMQKYVKPHDQVVFLRRPAPDEDIPAKL